MVHCIVHRQTYQPSSCGSLQHMRASHSEVLLSAARGRDRPRRIQPWGAVQAASASVANHKYAHDNRTPICRSKTTGQEQYVASWNV